MTEHEMTEREADALLNIMVRLTEAQPGVPSFAEWTRQPPASGKPALKSVEERIQRMVADGMRWAIEQALTRAGLESEVIQEALFAPVQDQSAEIARWCCAVAGAPYAGREQQG